MQFIFRFVVLIGIFGGFIYYMNAQKEAHEATAQSILAPYNSQIEQYLKKISVSQAKIPARGNVVFVDEKTMKLDKFSDYTLSPHNQPSNPNDVDTVILHNCDYEQVGSYTNGSKAMQHVCQFTVIEIGTGIWSNWGEFRGSLPTEEIKRKRGSTSDETGGRAIYSFFAAGGLVSRLSAPTNGGRQ